MSKKIRVKDIIRLCNGQIICGDENETLEDFTQDTRKIKDGYVYIGFKGERTDGNLMYNEALKNGAKVCILQKDSVEGKINVEDVKKQYKGKTIVVVENTIKALQDLAKYKRSLYDIPVIGITGSVGKTSTKDLIASVMSKKFNTLKTLGNYNNQIGLPLTILGLKDHEAMVIEMGMNRNGEISNLTQIAKPTVAVITNIGTAHIGNLGSRENILKAKLEILEGLQENGILIINNDNDLLHEWKEKNKNNNFQIITYGMENRSDFMPYNIILSENGSTYNIDLNGRKYLVNVAVGGNHFVLNSLCAIAIGTIFEIDINDILEGIATFTLTERRMQVEKNKKGVTIINDCYNANYDSMKAALEYLGKINANKRIAVLGDMLELGEYSQKLHEMVGKEVVKNKIDILITVGKLSKSIADIALKNGMEEKNIFMCNNNDEAASLINQKANNGDAILLKASNSLNFQEIFNLIYV